MNVSGQTAAFVMGFSRCGVMITAANGFGLKLQIGDICAKDTSTLFWRVEETWMKGLGFKHLGIGKVSYKVL